MAVVARRSGSRGLFAGPRGGTVMMLVGLALAIVAGVLVLGLARQARAAGAATRSVPQVYVVMATRDVAESSVIPADAVTIKPFPKAFAPPGALTTVDEVAGKVATTRLTRDQILLGSQVTATPQAASVSSTIPPGKVAFWMPLPELTVQAGSLRAGDRVDILLSLAVPAAQPAGQGATPQGTDRAGVLTTQTTLQNVEVFSVGPDALAGQPAGGPPAPSGQATPARQGGQTGQGGTPAGGKMALFVIDPQDAVRAKFIKDSGGTIDFVLRSREWPEATQTEAVNAQALIDHFGFRTR